MSTAGKVLVVLFLLTSLIWIVLAADVAQYETNANTRLNELTGEVAKLESGFEQTQHDIAALLDQTAQTQEQKSRIRAGITRRSRRSTICRAWRKCHRGRKDSSWNSPLERRCS